MCQCEDLVRQQFLSVHRLLLLRHVWEGQARGALSSPTRGQKWDDESQGTGMKPLRSEQLWDLTLRHPEP